MTTIDTQAPAAPAATGEEPGSPVGTSSVASFFVGAADWVTSTDHKKIGRLYVGAALSVALACSALGVLLGLERADTSGSLLDQDALLQTFQAYRMALVLGVVAPIGIGLSLAVAPMQLGSRSVAFARLALTGFYTWVGGITLAVVALGTNGGAGGGDSQAVDMYLIGLAVSVIGLIAGAGCTATTVLTSRAPGMTMRRVPLFSWSSLVGSIGVLVMMPAVLAVIVLLFVDHRLGLGADGGNFGGAEGLGAWLSWPFSVPAAIVYAVPAVGVAAELFPVAFRSRQVARGVAFSGLALIGVSAFAAVTQQYVIGVEFDTDAEGFVRSAVPFALFAGLPLLGVTVVLLVGFANARRGAGRPSVSAPLVFSLLGLLMIGAGVAGNALLGIVDLELHDPATLVMSSLEEGATLYVVYGSVLAVIGGVVFWAPKLWGRRIGDKQAVPLALLGFVGTVLASLPLYVAGFFDQAGGIPASDADVALLVSIDQVDGGTIWIVLSTIGHALVFLTVAAFIGLVVKTASGGDGTSDPNPYGAHTVEWALPSPAPHANAEHVPTVTSAEPLFEDLVEGNRS